MSTDVFTTEEPGLKQWMSWCDEKIAKFGDIAPGVAASVTASAQVEQDTLGGTGDGKESSKESDAKGAIGGEEKESSIEGDTSDKNSEIKETDVVEPRPAPKIKVGYRDGFALHFPANIFFYMIF